MCTVSRFLFRSVQNVHVLRADVRTGRPVFLPRRPPGWFSAGSRGKSCRKRLPSQGPISPIREMSRRDKRGRDAGAKRLRDCHRFAIKSKPQIQFVVWKGRNEHRGKETSLAAARSAVVISDAPPTAISFLSQEKRYGRKERLDAFGACCL